MIPATGPPRQVSRRLAAPIRKAARVPDADRYRKHFTAEGQLWLLTWHGCAANPGLRQTHAQAAADPAFWTGFGLPSRGVSRSQPARSSTSRPLACMETLLATLRDQAPTGSGDLVAIASSLRYVPHDVEIQTYPEPLPDLGCF